MIAGNQFKQLRLEAGKRERNNGKAFPGQVDVKVDDQIESIVTGDDRIPTAMYPFPEVSVTPYAMHLHLSVSCNCCTPLTCSLSRPHRNVAVPGISLISSNLVPILTIEYLINRGSRDMVLLRACCARALASKRMIKWWP